MSEARPADPGAAVVALASRGAAAAADAFGRMCGREVAAEAVRVCDAPGSATGGKLETAVMFELDGGLRGLVALLFSDVAQDAVLEALGVEAPGDSALREVGNIVASHAASAVADDLGDRVTLSVPTLVRDGAAPVVDRWLAHGAERVVTATALGSGDEAVVLVFAAEAR